VAGDGLNRDFSKRNSWGKKWKTCIPRGVFFFSVVQVFFLSKCFHAWKIFIYIWASFHGFNEGNLSHMKHLSFLCYVNTHSLNKVPNPIKVTSFEAVSKTKQNMWILWQTKWILWVFVICLATQNTTTNRITVLAVFWWFHIKFWQMKVWVGIPY